MCRSLVVVMLKSHDCDGLCLYCYIFTFGSVMYTLKITKRCSSVEVIFLNRTCLHHKLVFDRVYLKSTAVDKSNKCYVDGVRVM